MRLDFDLFAPLVRDNGVITLHDSGNYREPCGVPQLVEELRRDGTLRGRPVPGRVRNRGRAEESAAVKILLLQDHIYLPSYGGGVKANRMLLEGLARRGHECAAITPAFAPSAGPANDDEFREEMEDVGSRSTRAARMSPRIASGESMSMNKTQLNE